MRHPKLLLEFDEASDMDVETIKRILKLIKRHYNSSIKIMTTSGNTKDLWNKNDKIWEEKWTMD